MIVVYDVPLETFAISFDTIVPLIFVNRLCKALEGKTTRLGWRSGGKALIVEGRSDGTAAALFPIFV